MEIVYVRLVLMLSSSFKACVEGASEQRREIRRAVPLVMAVGLLIFAVGVVLSVLFSRRLQVAMRIRVLFP